ncbi:MAG: hypothetical protein GX946_11890 [Oligosphaeraceae bacterium]|nr:hypothetical protein [Oligosphaeraceae bacterium]
MNMLRLAFMLGLMLLGSAKANAAAMADSAVQSSLQLDLLHLFQGLGKADLLPEMNKQQEMEALRKLADTMQVPIFFEALRPKTEEECSNPVLEQFSERDGIFYLRLVNFQDEPLLSGSGVLLEQFKAEQGQALVLDLRSSWGFSVVAEENCYQFLKALAVPIIALMNGETAGTPESLLQRAQSEKLLLAMGTPSLGIMGTGHKIELPSGLSLRVPVVVNKTLPTAVQPDLSFPPQYELHAVHYQGTPDPCCRFARDTLKIILILGQ